MSGKILHFTSFTDAETFQEAVQSWKHALNKVKTLLNEIPTGQNKRNKMQQRPTDIKMMTTFTKCSHVSLIIVKYCIIYL